MFLSILFLASQLSVFSYAATNDCTDSDLSALNVAEEAGQMGEQIEAVMTVTKVTARCQMSDEGVDRVIEVFNRACGYHRLPNTASNETPFFPMLNNSESSAPDCQEGVSVINALMERRGLSDKEQIYARSLNLGNMVAFSQYLAKLVTQGVNLCDNDKFTDQDATSLSTLVTNFVATGAGNLAPFATQQANLISYFQQAVALTTDLRLRYFRSIVISSQFGFGQCASPQPQLCCPASQK